MSKTARKSRKNLVKMPWKTDEETHLAGIKFMMSVFSYRLDPSLMAIEFIKSTPGANCLHDVYKLHEQAINDPESLGPEFDDATFIVDISEALS